MARRHARSTSHVRRPVLAEGSLHDRVHGMVLGLACAEAVGLPFIGRTRVDRRDVECWATDTRPLTWCSSTMMLHAMITHVGSAASTPRSRVQALRKESAEPESRMLPNPQPGHAAQWATETPDEPPGTDNGAAVRSCALAVLEPDLDRVAADARAAARHTHPNKVGQDGAVAVAVAAALALRTPQRPLQLDPHGMLTEIRARVDSAPFRRALDDARVLLDPRSTDQVADALGAGRVASESVPAALVTVLRRADSYVATVKEAVESGTDTARIAAVAGALCGARLGTAAIPLAWSERLEHIAHVRLLADSLSDAAHRVPEPAQALP